MKQSGFSVAVGLLVLVLMTSMCSAGDEEAITIKDTGSTIGAGFQFTIYRRQPAVCVYDDWAKHRKITPSFPNKLGPPDGRSVIPEPLVSQFFKDVISHMPLSNLKTKPCAKSASMGSATYIIYKGETSPDIQCLAEGSRQLFTDYMAILNSLQKR